MICFKRQKASKWLWASCPTAYMFNDAHQNLAFHYLNIKLELHEHSSWLLRIMFKHATKHCRVASKSGPWRQCQETTFHVLPFGNWYCLYILSEITQPSFTLLASVYRKVKTDSMWGQIPESRRIKPYCYIFMVEFITSVVLMLSESHLIEYELHVWNSNNKGKARSDCVHSAYFCAHATLELCWSACHWMEVLTWTLMVCVRNGCLMIKTWKNIINAT